MSVQIIYEWLRFAKRGSVARFELAWLCFLAAFGATVKITFGPICVVAVALWLWFARPFRDAMRQALMPGLLAVLSVVIFCVAQGLTTGYPLYPSGLARLEAPWSMTQSEVHSIQKFIAEMQRTGKTAPFEYYMQETVRSTPLSSWFFPWLIRERASAALLGAAVAGTLIVCLASGMRYLWLAMLMGLSLSAFFFSPSIRYVLGVFAMAFALALALGLSRVRLARFGGLSECGAYLIAVSAMSSVAAFGFFAYTAADRAVAAAMRLHQGVNVPAWLLPMEYVNLVSVSPWEAGAPPPRLEVARCESKKASNFTYQVPAEPEAKVGNSGLMTTWYAVAPNLRLRDAEKGPLRGFERR